MICQVLLSFLIVMTGSRAGKRYLLSVHCVSPSVEMEELQFDVDVNIYSLEERSGTLTVITPCMNTFYTFIIDIYTSTETLPKIPNSQLLPFCLYPHY